MLSGKAVVGVGQMPCLSRGDAGGLLGADGGGATAWPTMCRARVRRRYDGRASTWYRASAGWLIATAARTRSLGRFRPGGGNEVGYHVNAGRLKETPQVAGGAGVCQLMRQPGGGLLRRCSRPQMHKELRLRRQKDGGAVVQHLKATGCLAKMGESRCQLASRRQRREDSMAP